jgi:hypothetical protein
MLTFLLSISLVINCDKFIKNYGLTIHDARHKEENNMISHSSYIVRRVSYVVRRASFFCHLQQYP